ncbi:MAG: ankyrin repeat domain-containing protein [Blastocatellia bacterium]
MNDQMMNEMGWPWQIRVWLQLTTWVEWLQPLLSCLLAAAFVSLLFALIDLALLRWREFHPVRQRKAGPDGTAVAPVSAAGIGSAVALMRSFLLIAMLQGGVLAALAQDHSASPTNASLNTAIRDGDLKQVKALLAPGVNLNAGDVDGTTPLMHAVVNAGADCVKLLLDKGADPNLGNKAGATALMWAVNDLKKVQLLLAKGAHVNAVSKDEKSPLLLALNLPDSLAVVKALLAKGANVNQANKNGSTPLIAAGFSGNLELVQLLLAKGADPMAKTKFGATYLLAMTNSTNVAAVKWALEHGLAVKDSKEDLLTGPAANGALDIVQLLLSRGTDPNAPDNAGYTPLMHAVLTESSSLELVKLLLDRGADPKVKAKDGLTALTFARRKGWSEVITLLTKAGAIE